MATTLAELEQRLHALEAEMASLRQGLANGARGANPSVPPAERGGAFPAISASPNAPLDAAYRQMGISGEAPGIEQLRAQLAAQGLHPGDVAIRREIAAMRDQEEADDA
jgi:ribosomal protein L29